MGATVTFDLIRLADIRNTTQGMELVRGVMVKDIPILVNPTYGADPGVVLKAMATPGFPQLYQSLPVVGFEWLLVKEQRVAEVVRKDCIKFNVIYRGLDPGGASGTTSWTIQDNYTVSYVQTQITADGSEKLLIYYLKGDATAPFVGSGGGWPNGSTLKVGKASKPVSHRAVTARAVYTPDAWNGLKATMRALAQHINKDDWNGTRGQWYYVGPKTVNNVDGSLIQVENQFLFNDYGWYPEIMWFNRQGEHPKDSFDEGGIRALGPPPENDIRMANGITIGSVVKEGFFGYPGPFGGITL